MHFSNSTIGRLKWESVGQMHIFTYTYTYSSTTDTYKDKGSECRALVRIDKPGRFKSRLNIQGCMDGSG